MEKTVLSVPKMWADHHVLKVREVLAALDGVEGVYASSAWKQVVVKFDPGKVNESAVAEALAGAGFAVGEALEFDGASTSDTGDPAWKELGVRVTKTNERDLELSGDFRRY
jgi:copper chaperone CopZ